MTIASAMIFPNGGAIRPRQYVLQKEHLTYSSETLPSPQSAAYWIRSVSENIEFTQFFQPFVMDVNDLLF
jgi:hypothetical protein